MNELVSYFFRVTPGFLTIAALIALTPRAARSLRLAAFVLLFMFLRDAMTPVGLWNLSPSLAVRFIANPLALIVLATTAIGLVLWTQQALGGLRDWRVWFGTAMPRVVAAGVAGGVVIAALGPLARLAVGAPALPRPEGVVLITACLVFSLCGNLLEEVLFRGHLQARLSELGLPLWRIVALSGGAFMICHVPLVFLVTSVGVPALVFTLYEGCICAWLRARFGLAAAALAHGLGLFLLAVT